MQFRAGDRVNFGADRFDRSERAADDEPGRRTDHQQQNRSADSQPERDDADRLGYVLL